MFTISDPSWVEVDGAVADKDLAQVKRGMPLSVRSQAYPNVIYQGRIDYIAPAIDAITHTVKVRGLLPNPGGALKDGMYVDVTVGGLSSRPVVLVPSTAVQFDPAGTFVFVPTGANSFDRKPVTLGKDRGTMTEILGGIAQGQKVVADGALLLSNGSGGGDD